jgi:tetratricopeptide (TPR) repeat protein
MKRSKRQPGEHARSRYMCVTMGVIEKLQQDYFAGRDLGQSIPDVDETMASVIVAESLEADQLWETLPELLLQEAPPEPRDRPLSDWSLATTAELFLAVVEEARKQKKGAPQREYWALAWATLEQVLNSPTTSPMLWYEDIFLDVGQQLRFQGEPRAVEFLKRVLAHDMRYNEGNNAANLLQGLAETYLGIGDLDSGLRILTAMVRNDPADIWTYNLMALTFDRFGLTEIGAEATRRGLELLEARGDPERLRGQLEECLDRIARSERCGREADVSPAVLADLRAALNLDLDAGTRRPIAELCHDLVPDLAQVPVKRPWEKPDLPPPDQPVNTQCVTTHPFATTKAVSGGDGR